MRGTPWRIAIVLLCLAALAAPVGGAYPPAEMSPLDQIDLGAVPLNVVTRQSVVLRDGPEELYNRMRTLAPGTPLQYLDAAEGWVRVRTPSGLRGWVPGAAVTVMGSDLGAAVYQSAPNAWSIEVGDVRVKLTAGLGDWSLAVEGTPTGTVTRSADAITVSLPGVVDSARWKVATGGVTTLSLAPGQLTVEFSPSAPVITATESSGSGLKVRLQPQVRAVTRSVEPDEVAYVVVADGPLTVLDHATGGRLQVDFRGAVLASNAPVPPEVQVIPAESGVTLVTGTARPHRLQYTSEGISIRLPPGGLRGKRILLDPGHGGPIETGAVAPSNGLIEKTINLDVAQRLSALLTSAGAEVAVTRTTDALLVPEAIQAQVSPEENRRRLDLHWRSTFANDWDPDLFISIHHNAGGEPGARGTETYYSYRSRNATQSERLAHLVQEAMVRRLGLPDRGVKNEVFYVTRFTAAPAVLVEVAFLSDRRDATHLADPTFRQAAAEALFAGIAAYFDPVRVTAQVQSIAYAPLRYLTQADVAWDPVTGQAIVDTPAGPAVFEVGSRLVRIGEAVLVTPVPPVLVDGRMLVPERWAATLLTGG